MLISLIVGIFIGLIIGNWVQITAKEMVLPITGVGILIQALLTHFLLMPSEVFINNSALMLVSLAVVYLCDVMKKVPKLIIP